MLPSVVVATAFAVAFLLEPLVRDAEALGALDGRREQGRTGDAPDIERTTVRWCRHCGQAVGQEYTFCGGCARPVPR